MADLRFTAPLEGMNGALSAVEQLVRDNPGFINLRNSTIQPIPEYTEKLQLWKFYEILTGE